MGGARLELHDALVSIVTRAHHPPDDAALLLARLFLLEDDHLGLLRLPCEGPPATRLPPRLPPRLLHPGLRLRGSRTLAVGTEPVAARHGPEPGREAEGVVRAVARVAEQQQLVLLARAAHDAVVLRLRLLLHRSQLRLGRLRRLDLARSDGDSLEHRATAPHALELADRALAERAAVGDLRRPLLNATEAEGVSAAVEPALLPLRSHLADGRRVADAALVVVLRRLLGRRPHGRPWRLAPRGRVRASAALGLAHVRRDIR
eukprot:scaffold55411_cov54-Phaeocystis_antarctica.AAC.2